MLGVGVVRPDQRATRMARGERSMAELQQLGEPGAANLHHHPRIPGRHRRCPNGRAQQASTAARACGDSLEGMDAITDVPRPATSRSSATRPDRPERAEIETRLAELAGADPVELTAAIGGERRPAGGERFEVTMPSDHAARARRRPARHRRPTPPRRSRPRPARRTTGRRLSFDDRAAVFLRAAELLAGPWRRPLNAATMLGQGKTVQQAEIDSACELIDFWRFNVGLRPADPRRPADLLTGGLEPDRLPAAGRLRVRHHAVQLHRHRREPAHRAGPDGQHGDLEAEPDPAVRRALDHGAAWRRPGCRRE